MMASSNPAITCGTCRACCCRLEVMLMGEDEIEPALTSQDQWGGWVMKRLDDGLCAALDRATFRCRIYAHRPTICRDFEMGSDDCIEIRGDLNAQTPAPLPAPPHIP
jgi:uncharacterized protein